MTEKPKRTKAKKPSCPFLKPGFYCMMSPRDESPKSLKSWKMEGVYWGRDFLFSEEPDEPEESLKPCKIGRDYWHKEYLFSDDLAEVDDIDSPRAQSTERKKLLRKSRKKINELHECGEDTQLVFATECQKAEIARRAKNDPRIEEAREWQPGDTGIAPAASDPEAVCYRISGDFLTCAIGEKIQTITELQSEIFRVLHEKGKSQGLTNTQIKKKLPEWFASTFRDVKRSFEGRNTNLIGTVIIIKKTDDGKNIHFLSPATQVLQ